MVNRNLPEKLDIGCGRDKLKCAIGIDKADLENVDVVHDLEKTPWPLPSDHFEYARAKQVIEHISDPIPFMEEVWRILKHGGIFELSFPYYNSKYAWNDPTHKRAFSEQFVKYFEPESRHAYYSKAKFEVVRRELNTSLVGKAIPFDNLKLKISHYMGNVVTALRYKLKAVKNEY